MYETALGTFVGLTIGNFIWQSFMKREWGEAAKISFFQAVALGVYLFATAVK